MKILFVEVNNHTEVLRSFLYAYITHDVVTLVAKNGKELKEFDQRKIHSPKSNQSVPDFLSENIRIIEEADLVIIITIEKWFRYFSNQGWLNKSVLVVFNGNFWFNYYPNIVFAEWKDVARFFKSIFKMDYYFRRKILKKICFVTFQNEAISKYMMEVNPVIESLIFPCLTYDLPKIPTKGIIGKNELIIVIPGAITNRTRNYQLIFSTFKAIVHLFNKTVKLVFLGSSKGSYADAVLNKFQSIANEGFKIKYYLDWVTTYEYDNMMSGSHLVIIPVIREMKYYNCREIGGLTKMTHSINEISRFDKVGVISKEYHVGDANENIIYQYENEDDLGRFLLEFVNNYSFATNYES